MALSESIMVAIFCMIVVFAVLFVLFAIIRLFSVLIKKLTGKKTSETLSSESVSSESISSGSASVSVEENFSSGVLKLIDVDEPTAAMIMAIVSDESGIPLSELYFKSIKKIQS